MILPNSGAQELCEGVSALEHSGLKSLIVANSPLLVDPLLVTAVPGDATRIFIVCQDGRVWIHHRGDGTGDLQLFLDLRSTVSTHGNEQGLLGMAFDPDYETTGRFFVNYTESDSASGPHFSVVARYDVSAGDPDVADPLSESRVLRFSQPSTNHNGGQIFFAADGYLYISSGDGGGGGDVHGLCGNGQKLETLLGKILRIDVRGVAPTPNPADCFEGPGNYSVPSDNPFADGAGGTCDEIYTYGLRNPWRNEIDPLTGDLYIADVGQSCWEEVNVTPGDLAPGANYGWRQMEGMHCFDGGTPACDPPGVSCSTSPECGDPSLLLPVLEYDHAGLACSVTGGYVYRGCRMSSLQGRYLYGDYCAGFIRSFVFEGGVATDPQDHTAQLDPGGALTFDLTSFGKDARGEIFIVDRDGVISKILPLFTDFQVSGPGAAPFLLGEDWSWEDLSYETEHPVASYHVYRAPRPGVDAFQCVHQTADGTPIWLGGDPTLPLPEQALLYLVTAVSPEGEESAHGHPSVSLTPGACP